jgi:hypothetical protein
MLPRFRSTDLCVDQPMRLRMLESICTSSGVVGQARVRPEISHLSEP